MADTAGAEQSSAASASLSELAADIFVFALRFRHGPCDDPFDALHRGTLTLFDAFEQRARAQRVDAGDVATAKYGLSALLDEVVLNSEWPGREQWADEPLQLRFFNNSVAGWGFFEKLEAIRGQDRPNADLLELYHLCLVLGFKGKYGVEGLERLQALVKVLDGELERAKPSGGQDISPHWKAPEERSAAAARLPRWLLVTCVAVLTITILVFGYLFFDIRLSAPTVQPPAHARVPAVSDQGAARC